jgi:hypothetical protein
VYSWSASIALAIDVTVVTDANAAATLATNLNGSGSLITINSANFLIDLVAYGQVDITSGSHDTLSPETTAAKFLEFLRA